MTAALWMTISALWWTPTAAVFQQQAPTDTTANDTADGPSPAVPRCEPQGRGAERVRVLMLDLKTTGGAQRSLAEALGQVIAEEASRVPGFEMLSTSELRAILDAESAKAMAGCTDSECLAEIASALDAELLIAGNIDTQDAAAPSLNLSLVNTRALVTINRVSMTWRGERELLPEVARAAAQRLVFEGAMRRPGRVVFEGLTDGARVVIDDEDKTETLSDDASLSLPVGPYTIRLTAEGHEPAEAIVLIQAGEQNVVDAQLVAIEEGMSTWWIWASGALAATVVLGGIVTALALTRPASVDMTTDLNVPTLATAGAEE